MNVTANGAYYSCRRAEFTNVTAGGAHSYHGAEFANVTADGAHSYHGAEFANVTASDIYSYHGAQFMNVTANGPYNYHGAAEYIPYTYYLKPALISASNLRLGRSSFLAKTVCVSKFVAYGMSYTSHSPLCYYIRLRVQTVQLNRRLSTSGTSTYFFSKKHV
jgi:hypothetical protein